MGWWKADPPAEPSSTPPSLPTSNAEESTSSCPVDPKTRALWLQQASSSAQRPEPTTGSATTAASTSTSTSTPLSTGQCSSDTISQATDSAQPRSSSASASASATNNKRARSLSHERVISSIPRAFPHQPSAAASAPSNSEGETGAHRSGNWIYPSEQQFFSAVLRKHDPESLLPAAASSSSSSSASASASATSSLAATIPSIIPIHNAVNERAWCLIQEWERPFSPSPQRRQPSSDTPCTGPKLLSFRGLGGCGPAPSSSSSSSYLSLLNPTTPLSPRARWNALRGYQAPFDRHDWVVERCGGERVEYVIDFYQGRAPAPAAGKGGGGGGEASLSFYLDVRPKLNSWVGWRTRLGWLWG